MNLVARFSRLLANLDVLLEHRFKSSSPSWTYSPEGLHQAHTSEDARRRKSMVFLTPICSPNPGVWASTYPAVADATLDSDAPSGLEEFSGSEAPSAWIQSYSNGRASPRLRPTCVRNSDHSTPFLTFTSPPYHAPEIVSPSLPVFVPYCRQSNTPLFPKTPKSFKSCPLFAKISSLGGWLKTPVPLRISRSFRHSQGVWIFLYFSLNLLLTLSNKSVLISFPFPYTLTGLHALFSSIGGYTLRLRGFYVPRRLPFRSELVLAAFSVLYAVNIAVSNVSLHLVTVPFHQVVRALTPIFTTSLSVFLFKTRITRAKTLTLVPVIFGVALATYGDYYFTLWGFLLTLFGTLLASIKTIYTNVLQSSARPANSSPPLTSHSTLSSKRTPISSQSLISRMSSVLSCFLRLPSLGLHPLDLLTRMSPLAFIQCVIYAQMSGELDRVRQFARPAIFLMQTSPGQGQLGSSEPPFNGTQAMNATVNYECAQYPVDRSGGGMNWSQAAVLLVNGCIAFGLNVVSLTANGKVGALSMTVAANVKQVLTILFAVSLFNLTITPTNAVGISITLAGGAWYAWVGYVGKRDRKVLGNGSQR